MCGADAAHAAAAADAGAGADRNRVPPGARAEAEFLRSVRAGQVVMVPLVAADLDRMAELVEKYADFPLGLVDASVVAVAERLGAEEIATLDRRDFSAVRPAHVPAFTVLP